MPNKPDLDIWDSCCLIGVLDDEQDKVPALLAQVPKYESGAAILGVPTHLQTLLHDGEVGIFRLRQKVGTMHEQIQPLEALPASYEFGL